MKKGEVKRLNLVVQEKPDSNQADVLLYGYIGVDWWVWDDANQNTDENFAITINQLSEKYERINIRINSPGGEIYHGNAIVNAIKNSKAEIHTYNDGLAASMAAVIWCAAAHRHMAKNALTMLHTPISSVWGNALDMRKEADLLDKFECTLLNTIASASNKNIEEIKSDYLNHDDHWLNFEDCKAVGFINDESEYTVPDQEVVDSLTDLNKINNIGMQRRAALIKNQINKFSNMKNVANTDQFNEAENESTEDTAEETTDQTTEENDGQSLEDQIDALNEQIRELTAENKKLAGASNKNTKIQSGGDPQRENNEDALSAYNRKMQAEIERNSAFNFTT